MKFNNKIVTTISFVLLVLDLLFITFLLITQNITSDKFIKNSINEFNFKEYVLKDEIINKNMKAFKYPEETFSYINDFELNTIKQKIINQFLNSGSEITKEEIAALLNNSSIKYQSIKDYDMPLYLKDDIDSFSNDFTLLINNDLVKKYNTINNFSNSIIYLISIIVAFSLLFVIIVSNKEKGLIYSSTILISFSFLLYYLNKNFFRLIGKTIFDYIENKKISLEFEYTICFILSFVLLLIYIFKKFKVFLRNQRIKDYADSWR